MFAICPRYTGGAGDFLQLLDDLARPGFDYQPELRNPTWGQLAASRESEVHNTDKEFRIRLELPYYKPEEVSIKSDNQRITIHAKHEEKQDKHGYVKREMTRIYSIPPGVDPQTVNSTMNSQGVLTIRAAKQAIEGPKETAIPVEFKQ